MDAIVRFAVDRMLARLARWLRLLGSDTSFDSNLDGAAMLKLARAEGRILITRDKRLKTAPDVLFLESNRMRDQLREIGARYPLDVQTALSRCSRCNSVLVVVDRETVRMRVAPFVFANNDKFFACPTCAHLYWNGTHPARIEAEIRRLGLPAIR